MTGVGQVLFAFFEDYLKARRAFGPARFEAIGTQ
jgi:hypothetical protein